MLHNILWSLFVHTASSLLQHSCIYNINPLSIGWTKLSFCTLTIRLTHLVDASVNVFITSSHTLYTDCMVSSSTPYSRAMAAKLLPLHYFLDHFHLLLERIHAPKSLAGMRLLLPYLLSRWHGAGYKDKIEKWLQITMGSSMLLAPLLSLGCHLLPIAVPTIADQWCTESSGDMRIIGHSCGFHILLDK